MRRCGRRGMAMIEGIDYFVYHVQFPNYANPACVLLNEDDTYSIYLNTRFPDIFLQVQLAHELRHIEDNHFNSGMPITLIELQADGKDFITPVLHPPAGYVPCFTSEDALARWINAVCEIRGIKL